MLRTEISDFKEQGFNIILMGDFNGWIGKLNGHLPGNLPDINENGKQVLSFITEQNLTVLNAYETNGKVFTHQGVSRQGKPPSKTCLDLALVDDRVDIDKWSFDIHDPEETCIKSDHSAICVTMENTYIERIDENSGKRSPKYIIDQDTDYTEFQESVKKELNREGQRNFARLSIDKQSEILHKVLTVAGQSKLGQTGTDTHKKKHGRRRRIKSHNQGNSQTKERAVA